MSGWQYAKGVHDIGNGNYAYLQPDGGWGWSNAGLVTDGEAALLVDTLFDERLTREMLNCFADAAGCSAEDIATVVNTHANGDHTYGNALVGHAEIVASRAGAAEMEEFTPQMLAELMRQAPALGELGEFLASRFGAFDFENIRYTLPTRTFEGRLCLRVGDKPVDLIEVGPAHTRGDVLVHLPEDGIVFTGDILFIEGTPVMWAGPVGNWIRACDEIVAMNAAVIVPGHGPITDAAGVAGVRDYLRYVEAEARARYDAGMSAGEAAFDIALGDYDAWGDAERIAVNVATLYREFSGDDATPDVVQLFGLMAQIAKRGSRA